METGYSDKFLSFSFLNFLEQYNRKSWDYNSKICPLTLYNININKILTIKIVLSDKYFGATVSHFKRGPLGNKKAYNCVQGSLHKDGLCSNLNYYWEMGMARVCLFRIFQFLCIVFFCLNILPKSFMFIFNCDLPVGLCDLYVCNISNFCLFGYLMCTLSLHEIFYKMFKLFDLVFVAIRVSC